MLAEDIGPMAQVAAIAVRKQNYGPRILAGDKPAVQLRAVRGPKLRILKCQIGRLPITVRIASRKVDQRLLEKHHDENDTKIDEDGNTDDADPERATEHTGNRSRVV